MHVVAGVLCNERGEVLLARRPHAAHQGGLWEFPGGKLEPGEPPAQGLRRELREELGVEVLSARPLIKVTHDYPDRRVLLDVWCVEDWAGTANGCEGQTIDWVAAGQLAQREFPPADGPVLTALRLPARYVITPEPDSVPAGEFLRGLEASLGCGRNLVQLRAKRMADDRYARLAREALGVCRAAGCQLLLNASPALAMELGADGVHLSSERLRRLDRRPVAPELWVSAACHDARELEHAARIGVDFVVLAPVRKTASHPHATAIGWRRFERLCARVNLPVYALGGMRERDLTDAWWHGAQGIAAIRGLWAAG